MERHRVGIVIPALNEAETIGAVVALAAGHGIPIVVDDGSNDKTGDVAAAAGAVVVTHNSNRGYDRALDSGLSRAAGIQCEYVVTMDADGQHDPAILGLFIQELDKGADVVVGVRDRFQRFAERVFAFVSFLKWGIRDPLCGMKAYRTGLFRELGHFDSYGSIGTELMLYAARKNRHIAQIAVKTRKRNGAPRFGSRLRANKAIMRALIYALWPPA
jgi:glycosyltransferase involved in cell wall biosynthesis